MEKNHYGQAKCDHCGSWHFAIYLDEFYKSTGQIKCCKCQRFFDMNEGINIEAPEELQKIENKNKEKLA